MIGGRNIGDDVRGAANFWIGKELMSKPGELAFRLAPDVAFGVMGGLSTPGDIGDKIIAGTQFAVGGGLGGIAAGRAARKAGLNERAAGMVDMGASVAGDMVGMAVGDNPMRLKGGGMNPYEKQAESDAQYRAALEEEFRRKYGIGGPIPSWQNRGLANESSRAS